MLPLLPKNSAEEQTGFGVIEGRAERPTGCCRHTAVVLHCSARSGPEKRNIRQEPAVRRSKTAEGLLCRGAGWFSLAENPSALGLELPSTGCISPRGHGPVATLRLQDKRNYRDSAETWMPGDTRGWKLYWKAVWRTSSQHLNCLADTLELYGRLLVS